MYCTVIVLESMISTYLLLGVYVTPQSIGCQGDKVHTIVCKSSHYITNVTCFRWRPVPCRTALAWLPGTCWWLSMARMCRTSDTRWLFGFDYEIFLNSNLNIFPSTISILQEAQDTIVRSGNNLTITVRRWGKETCIGSSGQVFHVTGAGSSTRPWRQVLDLAKGADTPPWWAEHLARRHQQGAELRLEGGPTYWTPTGRGQPWMQSPSLRWWPGVVNDSVWNKTGDKD